MIFLPSTELKIGLLLFFQRFELHHKTVDLCALDIFLMWVLRATNFLIEMFSLCPRGFLWCSVLVKSRLLEENPQPLIH